MAPLNGFSWKHGYVADTKGLLLWSDVFLYDRPTEKIAILLMDTQGLFETFSTREDNARIFGISTLISSMQIINIKGEIQEDQIEYLEMATSLTQLITGKHKSSDWKPFQNLLFLLRDWTDDSDGFGYEGGKEYLDFFLNEVKEQNSTASGIRKNIRNSFDSIECFLLNYPGDIISNKRYKGNWGSLNRDFVNNLKVLIESLFSPDKIVKKSILGMETTAAEFRDHIISYIEGYQNNSMNQIGNILQMVVTSQMNSVLKECFKQFQMYLASSEIDYDRKNFTEWIFQIYEEGKILSMNRLNKTEILDIVSDENDYHVILKNDLDEYFRVRRFLFVFVFYCV